MNLHVQLTDWVCMRFLSLALSLCLSLSVQPDTFVCSSQLSNQVNTNLIFLSFVFCAGCKIGGVFEEDESTRPTEECDTRSSRDA